MRALASTTLGLGAALAGAILAAAPAGAAGGHGDGTRLDDTGDGAEAGAPRVTVVRLPDVRALAVRSR